METQPRQSIAGHVGDRSPTRAAPLWATLPPASRQPATFSTEQDVGDAKGIPAAQPRALPTRARKTPHRERFNTTLRQRVSRLVRAALAFSKQLVTPLGAMTLFLCHSKPDQGCGVERALHGYHYQEVRLDLRGAYLNLDSGFDSTYNHKCIFNAGMSPNIKGNPRNRKTTKRGRKRLFNEAIHALRMRVERTFAWEDKFKRLLLRFEHLQQRHYGMKLMAYMLINLRAFCGT
jgi:hypothetical protein